MWDGDDTGRQGLVIGDSIFVFFFQAEDGIRDVAVTGVQTCALPICCYAVACRRSWILDRGIFKKGSCLGHEKNELIRQRKNIKQASAAPDGHLSIAERIPGKTYAWLEVFPCRVADEKRVAEMRVGVSEVSQVGELAINFRRYGGHLVAQPQIQCEIREPAPVVLQIPAKDGLSNITG